MVVRKNPDGSVTIGILREEVKPEAEPAAKPEAKPRRGKAKNKGEG